MEGGGIKVGPYQILCIPEVFFWKGEGDLVFFYEKGSKGKKILLQDM
jgi:hypothetical protein